MLYKDFLIERTKNTKLSSKQKKIRYIYHVTGKVYNKKTKHADDKGRICIGKMVDDTHFIPNDNYFDIYGNKQGFDLVDNPLHSDTLKIGALMLVRKVIDDPGLREILAGVHGSDESALISDFISYMVVGGSSSFQHFPDFMFGHYGAGSKIPQYLKTGITEKDIQIVLSAWNNLNKENEKRIYISYDSTNMKNCLRMMMRKHIYMSIMTM